MDRQGKSRTQRFFTRFVDAETAAAMEAHSRAWLVQCPDCGFERSIWDLGGVRYKTSGSPRIMGRCPQCGRTGWHKVYKAANFPTANAPVWPIVRLILSASLVFFIAVAVIVGLILKLAGFV